MFRKLAEGNVFTTKEEHFTCGGSRTAVLPDGRYICVFNAESAVGVNDFVPMVSYSDDGLQWEESRPLWPDHKGKTCLFVSVRNTDDGRISVCGWAADIAYPGEPWWSDKLGAMKENRLAYAISKDGYNFPDPTYIPLPYYGSCEITGGMQVDADGTMSILYSPYRTIEQREETDTNCLVLLRSTNGGATWDAKKIGRVSGESLYAEAWIARLSTGAYIASAWQTASTDAPDQYLYSKNGIDFQGPFPLPFRGQSTALSSWTDGRVLIPYNQRKEKPVGVWLCLAKPDEAGIHMLANEVAWEAATTTRSASSGDFSQWTDFSFGEPHVLVMPDGTFLLTLWFAQDDTKGVRYVHLACEE